jgi:hypothetical protein
MRFFLYIALFFSGSVTCFSQSKKKQAKEINDFVFSLHEETINKVLLALGDISGTSDYEVMLITGKYHWTVKNPRINIRPDSSDFICDALVKVSLFEYKTKVVGNVKISYDNEKNLIFIKISRAIFELYTVMFGKKVHIKDIHLEDHFKEPFTFEGPRTMATDMEFTLPDSTKKRIFIVPTDCKMELKWKEICTACEVNACDSPIPAPIQLAPPIESTKPGTLQTLPPGPAQALPTGSSSPAPAQKK